MANPFVHVELHTGDIARAKEFVRASTRKARELGAKVVVDVMEVGDYGTMSVITDPTGATLALWQPKGGK
jgi:predicted enzyme related to lactoylglutathione lyase